MPTQLDLLPSRPTKGDMKALIAWKLIGLEHRQAARAVKRGRRNESLRKYKAKQRFLQLALAEFEAKFEPLPRRRSA